MTQPAVHARDEPTQTSPVGHAPCHAPVLVHVWGTPVAVHCVDPGVHTTHVPSRQIGDAPLHTRPTKSQPVPVALHCCGCGPSQLSDPGTHTVQAPS